MLEFIGAKVPKKLMIMVYLCHCKQVERRLARKPVHLNFNYWKRTDKAGCGTGLICCYTGDMGVAMKFFSFFS